MFFAALHVLQIKDLKRCFSRVRLSLCRAESPNPDPSRSGDLELQRWARCIPDENIACIETRRSLLRGHHCQNAATKKPDVYGSERSLGALSRFLKCGGKRTF